MKATPIKINVYQSGLKRELTFYGVQIGKKIMCGQREYHHSADGGLYNKYPKHHTKGFIGEVTQIVQLDGE